MQVFVTGASGHLGSAVVPELIRAGHGVVALARSDTAAATVAALGAVPRRGGLEDLDGLRRAAEQADGVVHLAFNHDLMLAGEMAAAVAGELAVIQALGDALAGTGKALVATSGVGTVGVLGRPGTERDPALPGGRADAEITVLALAERGVRASVVRLPPVVHSSLDRHGFVPMLIAAARATGLAGYAGDGANRWPAVHTRDAAHLYRLALESAPAGTRWHGVDDEGVALREIAASIGEHLNLPSGSVPADQLSDHFGFLAAVVGLDAPTVSQLTRLELGWQPTHPGLLADLEPGGYFASVGPPG